MGFLLPPAEGGRQRPTYWTLAEPIIQRDHNRRRNATLVFLGYLDEQDFRDNWPDGDPPLDKHVTKLSDVTDGLTMGQFYALAKANDEFWAEAEDSGDTGLIPQKLSPARKKELEKLILDEFMARLIAADPRFADSRRSNIVRLAGNPKANVPPWVRTLFTAATAHVKALPTLPPESWLDYDAAALEWPSSPGE